MSTLEKILSWNYLKTTIVIILILLAIAVYLWSRNTRFSNIASIALTVLVFVVLLSNNFVAYRFREEKSLTPHQNNFTISQNDRDFVLNNYPYVARDVKGSIPTSHYEDGDYDVANNRRTYSYIDVRLFYYVHRIADSEDTDVDIFEFYSYFTTNGESIIEGSSHLHDFNRVYLYRYNNESTYFAIGYSTYNYNSHQHEWIYKRKKEVIKSVDHPILLIDASTNEYSQDQIADPTNRMEYAYLSFRELNNYELIIVIVSYGIAVIALIQIGELWYNPKRHIWYYVFIFCLVFPVIFLVRTGITYHSEFRMKYWDEGQTPDSDFWREGQTYIDIYGGPPWMKQDWTNYTISDKEDVYNAYITHKSVQGG